VPRNISRLLETKRINDDLAFVDHIIRTFLPFPSK
jgi:hypothetical protein